MMKKRLIVALCVAAALGAAGYVTFSGNNDGLAYEPVELALVGEKVEQQTASNERVALLAWNTESSIPSEETSVTSGPKHDAGSSEVEKEEDDAPRQRMLLASADLDEEPGSHVQFAGGAYGAMGIRRSGGSIDAPGGGGFGPSGSPGMPSAGPAGPKKGNPDADGPGSPQPESPKPPNNEPDNGQPPSPGPNGTPPNDGPGSPDPEELPAPGPQGSPDKDDSPNPPPNLQGPKDPPPEPNENGPGGPPHVPSLPGGPQQPPSPPVGGGPSDPPPYVNHPENPPPHEFPHDLPHESKPVSVPEPATLGLLGFGLVALGLSRRKKNAKNQ